MIRHICLKKKNKEDFPGGTVDDSLPEDAGDVGVTPGLGRFHLPKSSWAQEAQGWSPSAPEPRGNGEERLACSQQEPSAAKQK